MKKYKIRYTAFNVEDLGKDEYIEQALSDTIVAESRDAAELRFFRDQTLFNNKCNINVLDIEEYPIEDSDLKEHIITFDCDLLSVEDGKVIYHHKTNQQATRMAYTPEHAELLFRKALNREQIVNIKINSNI